MIVVFSFCNGVIARLTLSTVRLKAHTTKPFESMLRMRFWPITANPIKAISAFLIGRKQRYHRYVEMTMLMILTVPSFWSWNSYVFTRKQQKNLQKRKCSGKCLQSYTDRSVGDLLNEWTDRLMWTREKRRESDNFAVTSSRCECKIFVRSIFVVYQFLKRVQMQIGCGVEFMEWKIWGFKSLRWASFKKFMFPDARSFFAWSNKS